MTRPYRTVSEARHTPHTGTHNSKTRSLCADGAVKSLVPASRRDTAHRVHGRFGPQGPADQTADPGRYPTGASHCTSPPDRSRATAGHPGATGQQHSTAPARRSHLMHRGIPFIISDVPPCDDPSAAVGGRFAQRARRSTATVQATPTATPARMYRAGGTTDCLAAAPLASGTGAGAGCA
jgi:hypothetical protein